MDDAKRINEEPKEDLDTKKCKCKYLSSNREDKDKQCQKLEGEMDNLCKDLEKCQDEIKVMIWFDGSSDALDKMLKKQKHSKDTGGLGCNVGE